MDLASPEKIDISPEYLLSLSQQVDSLNKHALLSRRGSLTQQFSQALQAEFKELGQLLAVYGEDRPLKEAAIVKCKARL